MSAIALISTLATITSSPLTLIGMIPLIAVGLNYYRYQNVDPESAPIDAPVVSALSNCITSSPFLMRNFLFICFCASFPLQLRRHYDFIVVGAGEY